MEDAYISYLKAHNRTDEVWTNKCLLCAHFTTNPPPPPQMKTVDPESALKMYADSGEWKKCLELAEKQARTTYHVDLYRFYMFMYVYTH